MYMDILIHVKCANIIYQIPLAWNWPATKLVCRLLWGKTRQFTVKTIIIKQLMFVETGSVTSQLAASFDEDEAQF